MAKIKLLATLGICGLMLAACGEETASTESTEPATEESSAAESSAALSEQPHSNESSTTSESVEQTTPWPSESYVEFPQTYESDSAVYEINSITKDTGSMTGAPIIFVDVNFTNKTDQPQSPYMQFVMDFDVQQTDGTVTESLMGANGEMGNVANQEAVKKGDSKVNPGASINSIIGFQLEDEKADVGFITRLSQISGNPAGFAWSNE